MDSVFFLRTAWCSYSSIRSDQTRMTFGENMRPPLNREAVNSYRGVVTPSPNCPCPASPSSTASPGGAGVVGEGGACCAWGWNFGSYHLPSDACHQSGLL